MDGSTFWGIEASKSGCGFYFDEFYENNITNGVLNEGEEEGSSFTIGYQRSFTETDIQ